MVSNPTLYLLFNHTITDRQAEDARASLGVERIVDLPRDLKAVWRQIPPDLPSIERFLQPVKDWLATNAQKGDYVLIQGDFGACWIMVNVSFEQGLIPVYSTTVRQAQETRGHDGSVKLVHDFKHRIFRRYEKM